MKKKLILSTEAFPYGRGEKAFIMPELPSLLQEYDMTIVSHASKEELADLENISELDDTVRVVNIGRELNIGKRVLYGIRYMFDPDGWREMREILGTHKNRLMRLYQSVGFYALAMENYRQMRKLSILPPAGECLYYAYWNFYYCYSMTKHRRQYPQIKVAARTHGFELYNERYIGGRQPFKKIIDRKVDQIIFASEYAHQYYMKTYAQRDNGVYSVCRLGVETPAGPPLKAARDAVCLASCSNVIPLKRVSLIIDALSLIEKIPIRWIHFGAGEELDRLKQEAEKKLRPKSNIDYEFKGFTDNRSIRRFYSENKVDCFITTTSTEGGCPVSVQEAMAYSIPVIGTSVGGIPEMIDGNGILLQADPSPEEVAGAILQIGTASPEEWEVLSDKSYRIYDSRFNAGKNVRDLMRILKNV